MSIMGICCFACLMFLAEQLLNSPDLLQTLSCLWMAGRMRLFWTWGSCCDHYDGRILIALFKYGMPCFETIALGSAVCQTFPSLNSERWFPMRFAFTCPRLVANFLSIANYGFWFQVAVLSMSIPSRNNEPQAIKKKHIHGVRTPATLWIHQHTPAKLGPCLLTPYPSGLSWWDMNWHS